MSYESVDLVTAAKMIFEEAEKSFAAGNYAEATELYKGSREHLGEGGGSQEQLADLDFNIALCYAHLHDPDQCLYWLSLALETFYDRAGACYAYKLFYAATSGRALPPDADH
jgi:hypothetical protein